MMLMMLSGRNVRYHRAWFDRDTGFPGWVFSLECKQDVFESKDMTTLTLDLFALPQTRDGLS
jgi:hypothetical protein